ncbi:DUF1778 domain-containing protein [Albidovulum sp.]|uniref:type II toxin -antitoxin system TacA 1-like antitoxin n=1 Tax=Albidovulum sp. TaxID=1872424 RepID=UPI0039B951AB
MPNLPANTHDADTHTVLQPVDHDGFFAALDMPPAPNAALKAAFRRHRGTITSR